MKTKLFIYSGECKLGTVGEPTDLIDLSNTPLFVGDIVIVSVINASGICYNNGLSVVISAEENNKLISEEDHSQGHFVMGIASIDFMGKDASEWAVKKVKNHADVIDGEHWKDYGFNYKSF